MTSPDPVLATAIDRENPWPGLATFTEEQSGLFYGRDEEIRDLTRRAERNALTVLFGQSGLGKSSLLQAGVFPRLRAASYWPIYVRLDHGSGAPTPTEQIKLLVHADTARAGTWTSPGSAKPEESLWEFFHHRDDKLVGANGRTIVPVLVFDQFEELFTLGAGTGGGTERARAVAFMSELAELVENRPSEKLVARLEDSSAEMEAFDFSRTDYRVVITLREDFLPHLESLKTIMPALMENRMRLARMTGTQALEAVVKPGGALVTEEVARAIVEFVAGARGGSIERLAELDVEPPLLSVICRELNERRRALGQAQITADLVSGNRREILTGFYERSVADLPPDMRAFVEDHLLTKSGFRDNLALETALEFPGVTRPLIDTLVSRRLLRIEDRLGVQRVELTHDVLAEVIRASRDTRQQRLATEQLHQRERITRRRMWLARTIAAGLLVGLAGVSWIAWRAIRAEREQNRLRDRADALRVEAKAQELAALRKAYASDMNGVQHALTRDNLGRARELLYRHRPEPGEVDLRGWEWRYLWQFCQSDAQSVLREPNDDSVFSLAASADGQWVAVGTRTGQLSVYNLQTNEEIRVPAGIANVRVAFSPRQPLLAVAMRAGAPASGLAPGADGTAALRDRVMLWDLTTRQVVRELSVEGYSGLFFADDGETLVVGGSSTSTDGNSVWRVADGSKVSSTPAGSSTSATMSAATRVAVTRDVSAAATFTSNNRLQVTDLKTGQERWSAIATEDSILSLAFSADGRILASGAGNADSVIRLWDAMDGRPLGRLEGQRGGTFGIAFQADGKHLLSSCGDQTLRLWDLESRTAVRTFRGHRTEVYALALLPDQQTLVSGGKDGSVYVWDLNAERGTSASGVLAKGRGGWVFHGNGDAIVTLDLDGHVARRHGRTFQEESPLLEVGPVSSGARLSIRAVLDPKRPWLAVVTNLGKLQVWDWERRVLVREWVENTATALPSPRHFSADGSKLVVTKFGQGTFSYQEREIDSGRVSRSIDFPVASLLSLTSAISPDGTHVVMSSSPGGESVRLDLLSGRSSPLKFNLVEPALGGPAYSADGKFLVTPSYYGYARIFNTATYQAVATLGGFMFGVHSAAFSPDGERLAIGSTAFEAMTLWDIHSLERLLTLETSMSGLTQATFSPDGHVIAGQATSGASGGTLHFWRAPSWTEIEKAEAGAKSATKP